MVDLGELKRLSLKTLFPDEAKDFTPWLAKNIKKLNEVLHLDLVVDGKEVRSGRFSVDILAEDKKSKRNVVIENQYGRTDRNESGSKLNFEPDLYVKGGNPPRIG